MELIHILLAASQIVIIQEWITTNCRFLLLTLSLLKIHGILSLVNIAGSWQVPFTSIQRLGHSGALRSNTARL